MASLYDKFMYPAAHEQKYLTRQDWATSPEMYHKEIMDDYVTNVSKNLSEIPYMGNILAAGAELGAPIASATLSLPYDLKQSFDDFEKNLPQYNTLGSTIGGIMTAIDEQNPLSSLWHRTIGSLQPIKRRITSPNYIERQLNWKRQQLMNQRKQDMQQQIQQAQAAQAAKQKITPTYAGPITHDFDPKQDTGRRPDKPGGFLDPGKGSYGPHKAQGGIVDLYRHGGF
jgi:hypothetical protein